MITTIQITTIPTSGLYVEKVYDAPIPTENWTWVKLETNQYECFYGQFKGAPLQVALSLHNRYFYVLTDILLYEVDRENPSLYTVRDYYDTNGSITNVTLTPSGELLLSSDYELFKVAAPLCEIVGELSNARIDIENPIHLDNIKFKNWHNEQLHIQATYFATSEPLQLYFDVTSNKIYQKKR